MSLPAHNSGEYAGSTEYMKEYGGLIIDIATLVDSLDTHIPAKSEVRNFTIERIEEPLEVPESISEAIGEVTSAEISYDTQDNSPSITVELFGHDASYRISRSADSQEAIDSVINISPTDPFTLALLGTQDAHSRTHNTETASEFESRIKNITGVSNADFVRLLLHLAQPNLDLDTSDATISQLEQTNPFEAHVFQSFVDSSSVTSQLQSAFFEYKFLADDSAELVFSQENGHPSYFQFACNEPGKGPIEVRGSINKEMELNFPHHVVKRGIDNDLIDTTTSFPLTLLQIKYVRELLQEEATSIPREEKADELSIQDTTLLADDTEPVIEAIDIRIDNANEERAMESRVLRDSLDDELSRLIDEQNNDL